MTRARWLAAARTFRALAAQFKGLAPLSRDPAERAAAAALRDDMLAASWVAQGHANGRRRGREA